LAAKQGASIDELPSLQTEEAEEAEAEAPELEQSAALAEASSGDEAVAMDETYGWLDELGEDLAADEGEEEMLLEAPADTPAGEMEVAEVEASIPDDVPEDIDEAMAWLEQLAARQGAALDELPTVDELPEEEVSVAETVAMLDDIPDDPEEALAWLESLAGESAVEAEAEIASEQEAIEVVTEADTPAVPMDVVAARAEAEAALMREDRVQPESEAEGLEEMPEDPDEAMAWLERLAARQGASLDELPSLDEVEEELDTPAWIAAELAELEARADEADVETAEEPPALEFPEGDETEALQVAPEPLPLAAEEPPSASSEEAILDELAEERDDEDVEEALPDWLAIEGEEDDFEAWAEDAADLTQWLEAEEAATMSEEPVADLAPTARAALPAEPVPAPEERPAEKPEAEVPKHEPEAPTAAEADLSAFDDAVVEKAREAMRAGELAAAAEHYRALLESGNDVDALVVELENNVADKPNRALHQLLGDAYMQSGRLQQALDSYRQALESL
jgi:tetratricopeptide (TPR) repeat protein